MRNTVITRVVLLCAIAIMGIIALQVYWLTIHWNKKDRDFDRNVHIALQRVAERIASYNDGQLPSYDLIKRQSSNYYIVNINDVIDANVLEHYLHLELDRVAMRRDFEYAIYDCSTDRMVYGNYCSFDNQEQLPNPSQLPKYDEFTYYFGVKFPDRLDYIFSSMGGSFILSGLLLFTLVFFGYALFVILRQKRLSEMQKDFINNMTHEFKTPITSIGIASDVLSNEDKISGDERLSRYAGIISDQNRRLNSQVERVLNIARLEQGRLALDLEEVHLHEIIRQIGESTRIKLNKINGRLQLDLSDADPVITADPVHLTNVLHTLLDNAIKYSKQAPRIEVGTEIGNSAYCTLRVKDHGIGIAPEHQKNIFKKFYRVPTGNVHDVKGFGLGLYYIDKIASAHHWDIQLESKPGIGTSVYIRMKIEDS